jgi:hypothetical protein
VLGCLHGFRPFGDDNVHVETDQLCNKRGEAFDSTLGKAVLNGEVLPLHPAALAQLVAEDLQPTR